MRKYTGDTLRTTVEQNLMLRWVAGTDLPALHADLVPEGLAEAGAGEITDVTSCPGTDTCKLGISSSRGLAKELRRHLEVVEAELPPEVQKLHIKCSGCFNSCGQHHVADIGFLGVSRNVGGHRVPHFQLVVGGEWQNNGRTFGLAIGAIPSKRVPEAVERLTTAFSRARNGSETFQQWTRRAGRKEVKALVADLSDVSEQSGDSELLRDWGDPRTYTTGDQGTGECAGEVVSPVQFALAASERQIFEAQLLLDDGRYVSAGERARSAMTHAAQSLTREFVPSLGAEPSEIVRRFREHLLDPGTFDAATVGGRFGHLLLQAHELVISNMTAKSAHELIEEAQLFVDAAHQYHSRRTSSGASTVAPETKSPSS
jgi:sulfite reductase (ferredoxin)